ncbi:MAG: LytR C-terminal domain-containing protein [Candidatus Dojkabacteria bacterium]|nr:MAG: LytR C-terminal domain-containing protein [Candidatus Dojkabacteria bacterium]
MRQQKYFKRKQPKQSFKVALGNVLAPAKWISRNLLIFTAVVTVLSALVGIGVWFYYYSFIPGDGAFNSCQSFFVKIREQPAYGVIIDVEKESVKKIQVLGINQQQGYVSIDIHSSEWVRVFFSEKFPYSQVSELLRLSKLETQSQTTNYCWLAEQVSLLTGVPLEFLIVKQGSIPIATNVKMFQFAQILSQYNNSQRKEFNMDFIPIQLLEDGTKVPVVTFNAFREQYPDIFRIEDIAKEQAFVEVYNSSTISGYASLVSNKLTMLGIEVSRVGNASYVDNSQNDAIVFVKQFGAYPRTQELIISALPTGGKVAIREGRPEGVVTTGDIVVILLNR